MTEPPRVLAWGARVSPAFVDRVLQVCHDLGWDERQAGYLMSCMAFETGETFSATIRNAAGSGAIGLIQFMPKTLEGMGTSTQSLAGLTNVQQLSYVYRYFRPYAARCISLSDMYMAILMPKFIGKPDESVLFSSGIAYRQNSGLDANSDGKITKKEAAAKVQAKYLKGLRVGYGLDLQPKASV